MKKQQFQKLAPSNMKRLFECPQIACKRSFKNSNRSVDKEFNTLYLIVVVSTVLIISVYCYLIAEYFAG